MFHSAETDAANLRQICAAHAAAAAVTAAAAVEQPGRPEKNKAWVYSDNVDDPKIQAWLNITVHFHAM